MSRDRTFEFIEHMRKEGEYNNVQEVFLGKVISISPLKIKFSNIIVSESTFLKTRKFEELFDPPCSCPDCSCVHRTLSAGDKVLIIYSKEIDKYILVDKVV